MEAAKKEGGDLPGSRAPIPGATSADPEGNAGGSPARCPARLPATDPIENSDRLDAALPLGGGRSGSGTETKGALGSKIEGHECARDATKSMGGSAVSGHNAKPQLSPDGGSSKSSTVPAKKMPFCPGTSGMIIDMDAAIDLALQEEEERGISEARSSGGKRAETPTVELGARVLETDNDRAIAMALMMEESPFATFLPDGVVDGGNTGIVTESTNERSRNSESAGDPDEVLAIAQAKEENERAMDASFQGRAWRLVESALEVHGTMSKTSVEAAEVEPVAIDDMLFTVERLMEAQATFRLEGKDARVDIGYHYTRGENLERIKTTGLLSRAERQEKGVSSRCNGSVWGDGVYTANNPYSHSTYGDVGLLVARLKGESKEAIRGGRGFVGDTAIAHGGTRNEMVILGQSYQCVPLLKFRRSVVSTAANDSGGGGGLAAGNRAVWDFHCALQKVMDKFFNDGIPTAVEVVPPPPPMLAVARASPISGGAPIRLLRRQPMTGSHPPAPAASWPSPPDFSPQRSETYEYVAPSDLGPEHSARCSSKGIMPSGTMRISRYKEDVLAFGPRGRNMHGAIVIVYSIPSGVRLARGPGTERPRSSAHLVAFLPDRMDGRNLAARLACAFCRGLTFAVDDAARPPVAAAEASSGAGDAPPVGAARSLVPHKMTPYGSFPDPDYVARCNRVLDALGVPPWNECDSSASLVLLKREKGAVPTPARPEWVVSGKRPRSDDGKAMASPEARREPAPPSSE